MGVNSFVTWPWDGARRACGRIVWRVYADACVLTVLVANLPSVLLGVLLRRRR